MWEGWFPAEGEVGSEVSERECKERREREEERGAGAEALGDEEGLPLFPPTPSLMASADEEYGGSRFPFVFLL